MNQGIGLLGVLGIIFVVLKLVGIIAWSWWLVLLPFYGGTALVLAVVVSVLGYALICDGMDKRKRRKKYI